jgi:DNA mismatch repair protein MutS2
MLIAEHMEGSESRAADEASVPDLLHATPALRLAHAATDTALVFAFAGGSAGNLFTDALATRALAPSKWEASGFAADLFLQDFVRTCFRVTLSGKPTVLAGSHLVRVLGAPPADEESVHFRRAITAELIDSEACRAYATQVYAALIRFRNQLEASSSGDSWDPNRRQLEILTRFHELIAVMAAGCEGLRSGLSRISSFGNRIARSTAYQALGDLLRYDERLATLSFRVSVGADGRVRRLELLNVDEDQKNPFVVSPLRRWLAKLELVFRGFRFGDGEVMARLIDAVFEGVRGDMVALIQLCGDLEFYLGALGFGDHARAAGLAVSLPELDRASQPRELLGLFNPLLLGTGTTPIPCDIRTDRQDTTLLVTGPNSGGKTRLLQSLGLAFLMAQSGLFVPARKARMALAPGLLVSLVQEVRVDQAEGKLGMELVRIRDLFERLPPGAIVILDELCSGTNPSEGEEIFELVIRMLTMLRPQAFISTHFLEFAARLERERKITDLRFLQVELGHDSHPTYQFTPGVAKTSLAGQAAQRLGVTGEQLLALIERKVTAAGTEKS